MDKTVKSKIRRSEGSQLFSVPNNAEGREFIRLMRMFRTGNHRLEVRGRGSRKKYGNKSDIKPQYSEWMAVYHTDIAQQKEISALLQEKWNMSDRLESLSFQLAVDVPNARMEGYDEGFDRAMGNKFFVICGFAIPRKPRIIGRIMARLANRIN